MKKVASGVIFEGYEFVAGTKYIYAISLEYGKRNEKRVLTEKGKKAVRALKIQFNIKILCHNPQKGKV
jgi:uncharacterized protein with von Willebrand factor type A (vWA) domain